MASTYLTWIDGEYPHLGDGIIWNAPTAEDAAGMHVDEHVIPFWGDHGHPRDVIICVQEHVEGGEIERFSFEIALAPTRGFCTRVDSCE